MSPLLFWLIPRALINSSSRPHPTPPRQPGPSFKNLPVNMSLSCWQNNKSLVCLCPGREQLSKLQFHLNSGFGSTRCWAQILRQFGEGQRSEAKCSGPWEESVLAFRWPLKGTHICLPVGLSSFCLLQGQQRVNFLWVLYFYIVGKLYMNWITGILYLENLSLAWDL